MPDAGLAIDPEGRAPGAQIEPLADVPALIELDEAHGPAQHDEGALRAPRLQLHRAANAAIDRAIATPLVKINKAQPLLMRNPVPDSNPRVAVSRMPMRRSVRASWRLRKHRLMMPMHAGSIS